MRPPRSRRGTRASPFSSSVSFLRFLTGTALAYGQAHDFARVLSAARMPSATAMPAGSPLTAASASFSLYPSPTSAWTTSEAGSRADAGDADQLAERRALLERREAVQRVRVLAHHEMREQAHGLASRRQLVEGTHRHVELVGDAADVHQHLRRMLRGEPPGEPADQMSLPLRTRKPFVESAPSLAPWAWQIAQASASAASGAGSPGRASRRRTMCCTCSFLAWPLPTTDC